MKSLRDYINLVSETNLLSEKVTLNPDGSVPPTQTVNGVTMNAPANAVQTSGGGVLKTGSGAADTSGTPAPAPDAAAAAKAKLSPEQLKWLGGADPTDPIIMARLKKAVPDAPAAPAQAAQPAAPAATDTAGAYDDEGNMMPGWSKDENGNPVKVADQNGKTFVEPATQALADKGRQDAAQKAAVASGAQDDVTGLDAAIAAQAAAPAQAAQPAAPAGGKVPPQPTLNGKPSTGPKGQAWLQKYGATHNPDGSPKAGGTPAPAAAPAQKPALDASGRANAAADPRVAGAQPAQAAQPAPQAGAGRGFVNPPLAKESRTARTDHAFIDELNAMRSIAGLPTKNKW